jgi:precorrin-2 dehydrogenase/sirohydrochlorin ferrochelatase
MIPLFLDPAATRVMLVGRGDLAIRRLRWLRAGGARPIVHADRPDPTLVGLAGGDLRAGLPNEDALAACHALWIADLPLDLARPLAETARRVGTLVNVEDVRELCDFHTPALTRRGRLLIAMGTGGASPGLAALVRERVEAAFPPVWAEALEEIAAARTALRDAGGGMTEAAADARARLLARGLVD